MNELRLLLTWLSVSCALLLAIPGLERKLAAQHPTGPDRCLDAVFPIRDGELWGAINKEGTVLVEPSYRDASYGFLPSRRAALQSVGQLGVILVAADEWSYVDASGAHPMKPAIRDVRRVFNVGESLFGVEVDSEARNGDGQRWVLWAAVKPSVVCDPIGKWNPSAGTVPINCLSEGLVAVVQNDRCGFANRNGGLVISTQFEAATYFCEGLASVMLDGKWGYVDKAGAVVIPPQFRRPCQFDEGVALVARQGENGYFFINKKGERLHEWPHPWRSFSHGLALDYDTEKKLAGYCDSRGRWCIPPSFQMAFLFNDGLAAVHGADPDRSGFIDPTGRLRIQIPNAELFHNFSHGLAWVEIKPGFGGNGYVDRGGQWVWRSKH